MKEKSIQFLIYNFQSLEYKISSLFIVKEMKILKDTRKGKYQYVIENQETKFKSDEV